MKIIVLQGPPACGKSTWAKEYYSEHKNNTVIVCRDSIRESRGDYWVPSQENYITAIENASVEQALSMKYDVIIDATNLNSKVIQKWKNVADKYKCDIEFKEFYIPFEEAVKRDSNEDRTHHIGKKEIKKFYKTYYPERLEEEMKQTITHPVYPINTNLSPCIICDIDGTIAWMNGRSPYDYTKVGEDSADERLVCLINHFLSSNIEVIFLSGREGTSQCKNDTINWLKDNLISDKFQLYMRTKGDYRPDEIIKRELFDAYIKDKYCTLCVFDDRDKVVDMWRELGLLTCQVERGNF